MSKNIEIPLRLTAVNKGEMASVMSVDLGNIVNQFCTFDDINPVLNMIRRGIEKGELVVLEDGRVAFKNDLDHKEE